MILTSELAIQLAQKHIQEQNYLPGKLPYALQATDIVAQQFQLRYFLPFFVPLSLS